MGLCPNMKQENWWVHESKWYNEQFYLYDKTTRQVIAQYSDKSCYRMSGIQIVL